MVRASVVGSRVALAEVVGLDLGGVTAKPLPVDLVKVVGLEDEAGDNTLAEGGLNRNVDLAEEDILVGTDRGSIGLLVDGEDSTVVGVVDRGAIKLVEDIILALGEVDVDGTSESNIVGAL